MTALRQKMLEDMHLHGLVARTQESYLRVVRQLAAHYHKPLDQINEDELRQYFLYLRNVRCLSRSTIILALSGIMFFYEHTLGAEWKAPMFPLASHQEISIRSHFRRMPAFHSWHFCCTI